MTSTRRRQGLAHPSRRPSDAGPWARGGAGYPGGTARKARMRDRPRGFTSPHEGWLDVRGGGRGAGAWRGAGAAATGRRPPRADRRRGRSRARKPYAGRSPGPTCRADSCRRRRSRRRPRRSAAPSGECAGHSGGVGRGVPEDQRLIGGDGEPGAPAGAPHAGGAPNSRAASNIASTARSTLIWPLPPTMCSPYASSSATRFRAAVDVSSRRPNAPASAPRSST